MSFSGHHLGSGTTYTEELPVARQRELPLPLQNAQGHASLATSLVRRTGVSGMSHVLVSALDRGQSTLR